MLTRLTTWRWGRVGIGFLVVLTGAALFGMLLLLRPGEAADPEKVRTAALADCDLVETNLREALVRGLQYQEPVCGVNISGQQFVEIAPGIGQLRETIVVQANDNFISAVPATITQLTKLRLLELRNNHLKSLPRELSQLRELQLLDVRGNPLPEADVATVRALLPQTIVLF